MAFDVNSAGFPDIGEIWPGWKIIERIGNGSYGTVYKATLENAVVEDFAAVKVIQIPWDSSEIESRQLDGFTEEEIRNEFQSILDDYVNEIQFMVRFKGATNVVSIEDYKVVPKIDTLGWTIFIRMELLSDLRKRVSEYPIDEKEAIRLGKDICTALSLCEKEGILHRDIKPSNIMWHELTGNYKLSDFGIAKYNDSFTGSMSSKGSPDFMAPEVVKCQKYDSRIDIYSLGMVLYYYMNRRHGPFLDLNNKPTATEISKSNMRRYNGESLPPPVDASPAFAEVILRACSGNPDERFASANEFYNALIQVEKGTYKTGNFVPAAVVTEDNGTQVVNRIPSAEVESGTVRVNRLPDNPAQPKATDIQIQTPTIQKKSKSKLPIILVSILVSLLLIGGAVFAILKVMPSLVDKTNKLGSMVDSGKYETALDYYRENRTSIEKADAVTVFEKALDMMFQDYVEGKIEASDIENYISDLKKVQSDELDSYAMGIWIDVNDVEKSREAYVKAEVAYNDEDFYVAISLYDQVVKSDENYEDAQAKISECREAYKNQKITEAEQYANTNDFYNAIICLNDATAIAGSDSEIDSLLSTYKTKQDDYVFSTAASLADSGKYDEAINYLLENKYYVSDSKKCEEIIADYKDIAVQEYLSENNIAILVSEQKYVEALSKLNSINSMYSDAPLLESTKKEITGKYTEFELEIIEELMNKSDYESAYEECLAALKVLPGQSDFISKRDYCAERFPVALNSCFNSKSSEGYSWYFTSREIKDLFGNKYDNDTTPIMDCWKYGEWADFYLNDQFAILTLGVTPREGYSFDEWTSNGILRIYGDDKLIYETEITNHTTPNDRFDVDVSGVTWLRIELTRPDSYVAQIIFVDPELKYA